MNRKGNTALVVFGVLFALVFFLVLGVSAIIRFASGAGSSGDDDMGYKYSGTESVEDLYASVHVGTRQPVKGSVSMGGTLLYDELPEIAKYPLAVEGNGDIVLEVFSSGEKAGKGYESWLIDVAEEFNSSGVKTADGRTVGVSVRQVSSGLAADYIMSGKYIPDLYTPSNELFGEYVMANGGQLSLIEPKLVGNTAGVLVLKGKGITAFEGVVDAVTKNEINLGYTNPQTSASGLNFLLTLLNMSNPSDMYGDAAAKAFSDFQDNIPFVAYTTMQMRDSASSGSLDGMVLEYQTYVNEQSLSSAYDFIPYGVRHDNPLYSTSAAKGKDEAVALFRDFCKSSKMQELATSKGFNGNDGFVSGLSFSGVDVRSALQLYKENKDSGRPVVAVFVADCSGSMDGEAINNLRQSLTNGAKYINNNNYVGLVTYSSSVTKELDIAKFDLNQRAYFQGAVDGMQANGGTASYDAVVVAMKMIKDKREEVPGAKEMIFLLSDGQANEGHTLGAVAYAVGEEKIPIYTIGYNGGMDMDDMKELSSINEAASINADSDDVVYKMKSLFNSQM